MIDRALGLNATESYYFQLYPVNLILLREPVPSPESKFNFSIYKGQQKFDENKVMKQSNFIETLGTHAMPLSGCQLNFQLPNFNKARKVVFTLKLNEKQGNQDYDIGAIDIDPATYVNEFKQKGQNRFQEKIQISEQYTIQFQIYLEKSRFSLQKIVKSFNKDRSLESPVRQGNSPVQQRRSPVEQNRSPFSREQLPDVVQDVPQVEKSTGKGRSKLEDQILTQKQQARQEPPQSIVQSLTSRQQHTKDDPVQKPAQKQRSQNNFLNVEQKFADLKERSQQQMSIVSPAIRSKQMRKTSRINESAIKASVRLNKQVQQQVILIATKSDPESWTNHLPLVLFTIVGIVMIYWVMHPTRRV